MQYNYHKIQYNTITIQRNTIQYNKIHKKQNNIIQYNTINAMQRNPIQLQNKTIPLHYNTTRYNKNTMWLQHNTIIYDTIQYTTILLQYITKQYK